MVRVTKEWLESGMKGGVGIKSKQCKILGIPYPPPKGWKYLAIGRLLTDEEAQTFLILKDKRLRAKTFIEQAGWVKQENPISEKKPKHIVIKVKKRKVSKPQKSLEPKVEESLPVNNKGMITLTPELLKRGSSNGHWTKSQCMLLGIPIDHNKQFKKLLVGKEVSKEVYENFLSLKKPTGRKRYVEKMKELYKTLFNQNLNYTISFSQLPKLIKEVKRFKFFAAQIPYSEFLNSAYWRSIAGWLKEETGKCELCGMTAGLVVHHKTYLNHGDEINHLNDLVVLCKDCHKKEHKKHPELSFKNRVDAWGIGNPKAPKEMTFDDMKPCSAQP